MASTDQAASADNLAAKQAAEAIADSVLSIARAEAKVAVAGTCALYLVLKIASLELVLVFKLRSFYKLGQIQNTSSPGGELSVVVHTLRGPHHDLSSISSAGSSDLATIVETLTLDTRSTYVGECFSDVEIENK